MLFVGILATLLSGRRRWASPSRKYVHELVWCFLRDDDDDNEDENEVIERRKRMKELMERKEEAAAVNMAATVDDSSVLDINLNIDRNDVDCEEGRITRF